jgi:nitrous oxide reductase accessory protein NosL
MMRQLLMGILFLTGSLLASSEVKPFNVEEKYFLAYDKNTTCLVRQIPVYKDPLWVAKIEVRSGKTVYFSSPKAMFEFYFRPGKWYEIGVKSERDFSKIVVTDYGTGKPVNGETAYYVYGSDVTSPGGDDLVAFGSKEAAEKFSKEHSGARVMTFDEVSDALIRLINGRV